MNLRCLIFLLFPLVLHAQGKIQLKIVDENATAISRAIVIISQANNQIAFGTTNNEGVFEKDLGPGSYVFNIKKLGFTAITEEVSVSENLNLTFVLLPETNQLQNVVITTRPKLMRIKEDTISYNLKAVVDGTENKIEDVIKKLPGLDIDQDGKVLYKGQRIDNVLIDGNVFFGNKHQMATQNINAEMIEGIDLLTNYAGFALAAGGKKGIALNLKTKDSYKTKWVSDVEAGYGSNNALRWHSNSFKFFKKGNMAVISDYNTIAKTPISLEDYREMRAVSDSDNDDKQIQKIDIPTFLSPNIYIKEKRNTFVGLTYSSLISPRAKFTFSSVFNKANIGEENYKTQTNIGQDADRFSFLENKQSSYALSNTAIKWEFNKSATTFLSYTAGLTPNKDVDWQNLDRETNQIDYQKGNTNLSFAHSFKWQTKLFKVINYKAAIIQSFAINNQRITLKSSQNLFDIGLRTLEQTSKNQDRTFTLANVFSYSAKANLFSARLNYLVHERICDSSVREAANYGGEFSWYSKSLQSNFSWSRNWTPKVQSLVGVKFTNTNISFQLKENSFSRFEPNVSLTYSLSGLDKLVLSYEVDHHLASLSDLLDASVITDFQTVSRPSAVNYTTILPKSSYSLQYFNVNTKNYSVLFGRLTYSKEQNTVSNNTFYASDYIENQAVNVRNSETSQVLVSYDLKFKEFPLSLKSTVFYLTSKGISQFNGVDNYYTANNFTSRVKVYSNFKKSPVQLGVEYNFTERTIQQELLNFSNATIINQLTLSLRGKSGSKIKWDAGLTIDNQNSSFNSNRLLLLNTNLQYVLNKNIKLFLNSNNLLNLNRSSVITTGSSQSIFTESVVSIMPGYVIVGLNYSL